MTQAPQRPVFTIEEIVGGLEDRLEALCAELLPAGASDGADWVDARRAVGGLGDSMRVCLRGAKRGTWAHFGGAAWQGKGYPRGDALALVAYVHQTDMAGAIKWAKGWLGWDAADREAAERRRKDAARRADERRREAAESQARTRRSIKGFFLAAQPALRGTPAALYLRGRGIDLARLPRQTGALRFHPSAWCKETGGHLPALVAAVSDAGGEMVAVHRTYLAPVGACRACEGAGEVSDEYGPLGQCPECDGDKRRWTKAPLTDPKRSWGRYAGAAIRLWRGANGVRWADWYAGKGPVMPSKVKAGADPDQAVVITEGIEDGLTVALALPEARVLVAVSLANIGRVPLPPVETGLALDPVIAADADAPGSPAAEALEAAVAALRAAGRRPRLARAPGGAKDFNELLQEGVA